MVFSHKRTHTMKKINNLSFVINSDFTVKMMRENDKHLMSSR